MFINRGLAFFSFLIILSFMLFFSCEAGLGPSIDLEAPVLEITSHSNLDYEAENFILSGSCSDNIAVTRITVTDSESGVSYGNASVSGNSWSVDLTLSEGERNLRVTAYDRRNNSSVNSVKQITLLIDATDPFINELEIERQAGVLSYLEEKAVLEGLDENAFINVDYFQNESFQIRGDVIDNFPLTSVSLSLWDDTGSEILQLSRMADSTNNSPVWEITESDLIGINTAYATGRHYFRVTVTATDASANQNVENVDQFLWFCWYPESDNSRIKQSMVDGGSITIPKDSSLPVEIYDDDNLAEVYIKLLPAADWDALGGSTTDQKLQGLENDSNRNLVLGADLQTSTVRNAVYTISTGAISSEYNLVVLVKDLKSSGAESIWTSLMYPVLVTDENAPITVIETPDENTFPDLPDGENFVISGYTLDNGGATSMLMAWIPAGIPGGADAQIDAAIASLSDAAETMTAGTQQTLGNGVKIWSYSLGTATDETISGSIYKKKTFSHSFNVLTDFIYDGSLENDSKLMVFLTLDADGNEVSRNFRLYGNIHGPEITVNYPVSDLQVHNISNPLTISFTANSASGLTVDSYSIDDCTNPGSPQSLTLSGTGDTRTVGITGLTEGRRVYRFSATDVLGNTSMVQRTLILSNLPALEYITSSGMDGTYKAGDSILLQAVFSSAVKVTGGTPRMRLRYNGSDATDKFAAYISGSGTNTLVFEYIVPVGADASELQNPDTPIDLNSALIETTLGSGGAAFLPGISGVAQLNAVDTLQGNKNIMLDGVAPSISTLVSDSGSYRTGNTVNYTLNLSENILVSGSPVLRLIADSPASIGAGFLSISGMSINFSYTVVAGDRADPVSYDLDSLFSASDSLLITDMAGNPLSQGPSSPQVTSSILDTSAPTAPVLSLSSGSYNSNQTLTLSGIEAGTSVFYSEDGGVSWSSYTAGVPLGNGTYQLTAYQMDVAGNRSPNAAVATVNINGTFPSITSVSCLEPNGTYPEGSVLHFKVSFDDTVRTTNGSGTLEINGTETVSITENASGATSLEFIWTVPAGLAFSPVDVTSIDLSGVEDLYSNAGGSISSPTFSRPALIVDSVAPYVTGRTPVIDGVLDVDGSGNSVITVVFNEPVYAESGMITVRRDGDWLVPPVLSRDEFSEVFYSAALTDTQRGYLMETETNGSATLSATTGKPVGPYKETTHGLILQGGDYVPDTSTKYVLDFERGLDDALLREAFEAAGYHQQELDVTSFRVTGSGTNTITITLADALVRGRQWELLLDAGAFRDAAGNTSAEILEDQYTFWSEQVATPVVRVERYSHGWGEKEYYQDGTQVSPVTAAANNTAKPTAYVRYRIDCETPGATILRDVLEFSSTTVVITANAHENSTNADPEEADLSSMTIASAYSTGDFLTVGDGLLTTARKDYIGATATLAGLSNSERGFEGAFKTLMYYRRPGMTHSANLKFQGSNIEGGMPTISGFPLHDNDPDERYSKYAYEWQTGDTWGAENDWVWISYDFVSYWSAQSVRDNWQQGYNDSYYGDYTYTFERVYY